MALKQLHLNDGNKTPIEPVISNDSIADNMITLNKLAEPVTTEAEMTLFETNVNNRISALEDNKQANIDGKVTSFKNGTKFTGNLTLSLPNNTDLQVEGKGLKQYITDNIPPSTGGGGGAGVQLSAPNTATNGMITQGQLTTLQESDLNYIIFNNEIYSLNDKTHTADTLTYSHVGFENGKHLLKTISITVSTRAWVLNTTIVSQGGAPAPTDELLGTWVFNDNIPVSSSVSIFNITFISDSTTYKSIIYGGNTGIDFSTSVPSGSFVPVSGNAYSTTWVKEAYKTIEITNVDNLSDKSSFLAWLKSNATKQGNGGSGGGTTGKEFGYTLKTNSYFPNSFLVFGGETTFNNKQNEPENWYGWHDIKTGGGTTKNALMFIMIRNYSNAVNNGNIYDANGTIVNNSSIDPLRVNVLYLLGSDATIWSRD